MGKIYKSQKLGKETRFLWKIGVKDSIFMKLPGFGLQVRSGLNEENFPVKFASAFAIPRAYLLHNLSITRYA